MRLALTVGLASDGQLERVRRREEIGNQGKRGGQVQHEIERVRGEQQRDEQQ
jgi:hypothetical protein